MEGIGIGLNATRTAIGVSGEEQHLVKTLVAVLAESSEAADIGKAPPIRSRPFGHRKPAAPGRRLKCLMVTFGLFKISQRKFSDGVRKHVSGAAIA